MIPVYMCVCIYMAKQDDFGLFADSWPGDYTMHW